MPPRPHGEGKAEGANDDAEYGQGRLRNDENSAPERSHRLEKHKDDDNAQNPVNGEGASGARISFRPFRGNDPVPIEAYPEAEKNAQFDANHGTSLALSPCHVRRRGAVNSEDVQNAAPDARDNAGLPHVPHGHEYRESRASVKLTVNCGGFDPVTADSALPQGSPIC